MRDIFILSTLFFPLLSFHLSLCYLLVKNTCLQEFLLTCTGAGKTQLAFALLDKSVVYLLVTPLDSARPSQPLYRGFEHLAAQLNSDIQHDLNKFPLDCPHISTSIFNAHCTVPLRFLGLIHAICQHLHSEVSRHSGAVTATPGLLARRTAVLEYSPLCLSDFVAYMAPFRGWVFILDEIFGQLKGFPATRQATLLRNALRLSSLTTVLMGTDSSLCNMIANQQLSRPGLSTPAPWAFIISKLPDTNYDAIVRHHFGAADPLFTILCQITHDYVRRLLQGCRPFVVFLALQHVKSVCPAWAGNQPIDAVQQLLDGVSKVLLDHKTGDQFFVGQVALLLSSYTQRYIFTSPLKRIRTTNLDSIFLKESVVVSYHFCSTFCQPEVYQGNESLLTTNKECWTALSYFAEAESFLWLALCNSAALGPAGTVLNVFKKQFPLLRLGLVYANPKATKPTGEFLEAIAYCAIQHASHGSLKGTPAAVFLARVLAQLNISVESCDVSEYPCLAELVVPYLLPPCVPLSYAELLPPGALVEEFQRPVDAERVDGISPTLLLECKDHNRALELSEVISIMTRLCAVTNQDRALSLVFCQSLQGEYFTRQGESFDAWVSSLVDAKLQAELRRTHFLRLHIDTSDTATGARTATLRPVFTSGSRARAPAPPVPQQCTRAVVFIPLRTLDSEVGDFFKN